MGSNFGEKTKIVNDAAECSETTVEIKIKTLDSQTFTLRVDKYVPVPELKEQIASLTGVLSEQQRLICRGKVLKDDQLLSAYHVEDGHTLHLVVRQPAAPSLENSFDHPAPNPSSNIGLNTDSRVSPGMLVGTFNVSEQGDGSFPDLSRIVSAVISSLGMPRLGNGGDGIDLNLLPSERPPNVSGSIPGILSRTQPEQLPTQGVPVEVSQPPVIPDSLTTLSQYLNHLRQEFISNDGGQVTSPRIPDVSGSITQESNPTVQTGESRGLLTPESLANVMTATRQLLISQASECLSQLAGQLNNHTNMTDPSERLRVQSYAMRLGALFQNLGAFLLELGRTIMTLRMGQAPADSMVNAGPSVFVSSTGPNPIMVQPLPFQPGANFGSFPVGSVQNGSGLAAGSVGSGLLPRNIDIRIRTGSVFSRRDANGSQPPGQASSNSVHPGQQENTGFESNSNRESQMRAVPVRTVVAAVPPSVGRGSDSPHSSIGILYPVLARVQPVPAGNPTDSTTSQASDQHPSIGNSSTQQMNDGVSEGNEAFNGRLEQLLRTIFPASQIINENANPLTGFVPIQTEATRDVEAEAASSNLSGDGIFFSNALRQLMPIILENNGTESNPASVAGPSTGETQDDESRDEISPPSPPSSKRQKRE